MQLGTDPRCASCSHKWSSHYKADGKGGYCFITCQIRRSSQWDDITKAFLRDDKCECPGYRGPFPNLIEVGPEACPHELLPNTTVCLHCRRQVKVSR